MSIITLLYGGVVEIFFKYLDVAAFMHASCIEEWYGCKPGFEAIARTLVRIYIHTKGIVRTGICVVVNGMRVFSTRASLKALM